jgi:hypothetical protein
MQVEPAHEMTHLAWERSAVRDEISPRLTVVSLEANRPTFDRPTRFDVRQRDTLRGRADARRRQEIDVALEQRRIRPQLGLPRLWLVGDARLERHAELPHTPVNGLCPPTIAVARQADAVGDVLWIAEVPPGAHRQPPRDRHRHRIPADLAAPLALEEHAPLLPPPQWPRRDFQIVDDHDLDERPLRQRKRCRQQLPVQGGIGRLDICAQADEFADRALRRREVPFEDAHASTPN